MMFWDQVAGVYDIFVNVINRKTHKILKEIVSDLIEPDDVVLECACGTGLLSAVIAQKCRRLTATDFSGEMLKKAEKNCTVFQNITFAKADITALAFPDCSFDKVVAGNVIHLLDNPLTALGELNRVCKDEKPGQILNDSLQWIATDSFFWTRGTWMCRSYWLTDAFHALLPS